MPNKVVTIKNTLGLHLRAALKLVNLAHQYKSDIYLQKDDIRANGKSMLGIITLGASCGSSVEIMTNGSDAQELLDSVIQLIERKFDEEE
ncbi:HPr family phosphocarrier protein [bacterium]|nr:HPr family phosphocarrier protein [bacterium]